VVALLGGALRVNERVSYTGRDHWFVSSPKNPYPRSKPLPFGHLRHSSKVHLVVRHRLPLPHPYRCPAELAEDLRQRPVLGLIVAAGRSESRSPPR